MSYETAPATKMLATHCACCARPLVDATSVETGVGPECRKKHGYTEAQGPADMVAAAPIAAGLGIASDNARELANKAVHLIAHEASGGELTAVRLGAAINLLQVLGYIKLANRCSARVCSIEIEGALSILIVRTPYNETFLNASRRIAGRRWDKALKATTFPKEARPAVWAALQAAFPGHYLRSAKGLTVIPTASKAAA